MNNKPIKILTTYIFILVLINFPRADDVKWIGNLRYRILQDKNSAEGATSSLSEMRSRFGFSMGFGKTSSSFILQESMVIGKESNYSGVTSRPPSPFLYEVSFKIQDFLLENVSCQFGRFELALGNQRIISKNNWNSTGRTFEGFLISENLFNKFDFKTFSFGINEKFNDYHDDRKDSWLNGIYIASVDKTSYELYFIDFTNSESANSYTTIGTRVDANLSRFNLEGEYALQTSENISSSSLLSLNFGFQPKNIPYINNIALGFDYVSGDDSSTTNLEGFSKFFGARHKFHGFYDYGLHKSFMNHSHDGLRELNAKTYLNFLFGSKLLIAVHSFKSGVNDINYGNEIDFIIKRNISDNLSFESGLALYQPEPMIGRDQDLLYFSYLALTASFK
tara:strand:- start:15296 stop:16474 length:1179 start_codon:yes stop_codon:yes gene_type:complete